MGQEKGPVALGQLVDLRRLWGEVGVGSRLASETKVAAVHLFHKPFRHLCRPSTVQMQGSKDELYCSLAAGQQGFTPEYGCQTYQ